MRNQLKNWKEVIDKLDDPRSRPTDFQAMILRAMRAGLNNRDASRLFGVSEWALIRWKNKFGNMDYPDDRHFYTKRALDMGAEPTAIDDWLKH